MGRSRPLCPAADLHEQVRQLVWRHAAHPFPDETGSRSVQGPGFHPPQEIQGHREALTGPPPPRGRPRAGGGSRQGLAGGQTDSSGLDGRRSVLRPALCQRPERRRHRRCCCQDLKQRGGNEQMAFGYEKHTTIRRDEHAKQLCMFHKHTTDEENYGIYHIFCTSETAFPALSAHVQDGQRGEGVCACKPGNPAFLNPSPQLYRLFFCFLVNSKKFQPLKKKKKKG